ncbi:hypothetical protein GOV11_03815 [Candidatus Woesearchaeota archaeon]|nr:hypothetical protein [Candidatus Woesearchaeota archaeon]
MSIFTRTAGDNATQAANAASRAENYLLESANLLKDVRRILRRLSDELPKKAPHEVTDSIKRTMRHVERQAQATSIHMRKLDTHVKRMEKHVLLHKSRSGKG